MEGKIFGHATHITNTYFSFLLPNWIPQSNKSIFFDIAEKFPIFCSLFLGFCTAYLAYVLYRIIQWMCIKFKATYNYTIYNRECCPICLNEFIAPIRADCGHAFCIECLLDYFTTNPPNSDCPLCRNFIQDFECLNKYVFEDKDRAHASQLQETLRNLMPQQMNYILRFLEEEGKIILALVTYLVLICIMYYVLQLL